MEDKLRQCKICAHPFIWTAGEQQFYQDRFLDPPTRCHDCRKEKRLRESRIPIKQALKSPLQLQ